jgi:hypothetical protein
MADGTLLFRTILVLVAGIALIAIIYHYNTSINENFEGEGGQQAPQRAQGPSLDGGGAGGYDVTNGMNPMGKAVENFEGPRASAEEDVSSSMAPLGADAAGSGVGKGAFRAQDLLPKLGNSREEQQFAQLHPAGQGDVQGVNFLDAGSLIGQTTSLKRNANHQLRSDPPIEKKNVSPWMMSTITPDTIRKGLEIGTW